MATAVPSAAPSGDTSATTAVAPTQSYSTDPALYIYTSLTAGSSHIVTATSRLETILRANRVPFKAVDLATDEKARMLWGRRAGKDASGRQRKLPGLVQMGFVLGDLVEIEEWNEYGELKQHVTMYYDDFTQPSIGQAPKAVPTQKKPAVAAVALPAPPAAPAATAPTSNKVAETVTLPIRSIAAEAAQKAKQVRLDSLREKVHGSKSGVKQEEKADSQERPDTDGHGEKGDGRVPGTGSSGTRLPASLPASLPAAPTGAGLQSPTTGGWKESNAFPTLQSPITSSWKPADPDAHATVYSGSVLKHASREEIEAIEMAEAIQEVDEPSTDAVVAEK